MCWGPCVPYGDMPCCPVSRGGGGDSGGTFWLSWQDRRGSLWPMGTMQVYESSRRGRTPQHPAHHRGAGLRPPTPGTGASPRGVPMGWRWVPPRAAPGQLPSGLAAHLMPTVTGGCTGVSAAGALRCALAPSHAKPFGVPPRAAPCLTPEWVKRWVGAAPGRGALPSLWQRRQRSRLGKISAPIIFLSAAGGVRLLPRGARLPRSARLEGRQVSGWVLGLLAAGRVPGARGAAGGLAAGGECRR